MSKYPKSVLNLKYDYIVYTKTKPYALGDRQGNCL